MRAVEKPFRALALTAFLFAGCASANFDLSFLQGNTAGGDRLVAASLDSVSASAQASLGRLGMSAEATRQGEAIHIASKTPGGSKFKLVLTREKGKETEHTRVHIEWEGRSDEQTVFQILSQLDLHTAK